MLSRNLIQAIRNWLHGYIWWHHHVYGKLNTLHYLRFNSLKLCKKCIILKVCIIVFHIRKSSMNRLFIYATNFLFCLIKNWKYLIEKYLDIEGSNMSSEVWYSYLIKQLLMVKYDIKWLLIRCKKSAIFVPL